MRNDVLSHFYGPNREGRRMDLRGRLGEIHCPVLVLAGEEDPITPIDDALELVRSLTGAQVTFRQFQNCGHGVYFDKRAEFHDAIRTFIEPDNTKLTN